MREINKIIIHCSASTFGNAKKIRQWHKERGWSDIGYHYVINNGRIDKTDKYQEHITDGLIEKGRDIEIAGAHCKGHNHDSIGICLIGTTAFSDNQMFSLEALIDGLLVQYDLKPSDIYGHYDFTDKKTCPNFDVQNWVKETYEMRRTNG